MAAESHGFKGASSAFLNLPTATFISCPRSCWKRQRAISSSLFPCHFDFMDFYHILHLQAKKSYSWFILPEEAVSFLWFGMLFPWFSTFWSSAAFHLRHRTKTLDTLLWIKVHNMQWHYNAFCFVYISFWFFSISNFLFLFWITTECQADIPSWLIFNWLIFWPCFEQGVWGIISPDVSSNFNNSVSLWFKLRGQQVKYFYFATA